jgi:hypothetical protein
MSWIRWSKPIRRGGPNARSRKPEAHARTALEEAARGGRGNDQVARSRATKPETVAGRIVIAPQFEEILSRLAEAQVKFIVIGGVAKDLEAIAELQPILEERRRTGNA